MRVRYGTKKLEKLCTDEREMRRKRNDIADRLRLRIKALETAKNIEELPVHDPLGRWHPLRADMEGLWAGWLSVNYRLLVRPEEQDQQAAVAVTVVDIADYH